MKILYGVQGTGNGHITRARAMQKEFANTDIKVDYLFSGRNEEKYFDMQCFENTDFRKGLSLNVKNGKVKYIKTAIESDIKKFKKDVKSFDATSYDLILTDFEPITAHIAKKQNIPVIGIGHQYVFEQPIPQQKGDFFAKKIFKYYAPAKRHLALHWHHFDEKILPPIVSPTSIDKIEIIPKKVIVYLPFENQQQVLKCLAPINDYQFIIYSPITCPKKSSHIIFKPLSRKEFLNDLYSCDAVISNAGFELSSEALKFGKRLLVKPLSKQVEQQSNALALKKLLYGSVMSNLNTWEINKFLELSFRVQINYPNTAKYIVNWIQSGCTKRDINWYKNIWNKTKVKRDYEVKDKSELNSNKLSYIYSESKY